MPAPIRILIVDDHAGFRGMLQSLLGNLGAEVVACGDGSEAVERFIDFAPDWVVMDIEMPRLDGLLATEQIVAANPQARVVILSQHDGEDSREAAREAGACEFLAKDNLEMLPAILFPKTNRPQRSV
jgi:two-component system response regulator DegU